MALFRFGVALLSASAFGPYGSAAYAAEGAPWLERAPWYVGAGAGSSRFSVNSNQLSAAFPSIGVTANIDALESRSTGAKINGGFRVNKHLALEAGYADFGMITFAASVGSSCPIPPATVCPAVISGGSTTGEIAASGWSLSAMGTLPINERFAVTGRLGAFLSTVELRGTERFGSPPSFVSQPFPMPERTVRRSSPLIGIGIEYRITPRFTLALDWEQIDKLGNAETTGEMNIEALSVGIKYEF